LNELDSYDLIDFFLPRNNKIFPLNKIKESLALLCNDAIVRNMYKELGYVVSQTVEPADLEKIPKYYLVWYKLNNNSYIKLNNNNKSATTNFQFREHINEFLYDRTRLPSNNGVLEHIKRLKNGWNHPIETIVAYDTGLIVDATKHSLALYYIKQTEEERLHMLLQEDEVVNPYQMNSFHSRTVFYQDFATLSSCS
jgi:hypothetical protein